MAARERVAQAPPRRDPAAVLDQVPDLAEWLRGAMRRTGLEPLCGKKLRGSALTPGTTLAQDYRLSA